MGGGPTWPHLPPTPGRALNRVICTSEHRQGWEPKDPFPKLSGSLCTAPSAVSGTDNKTCVAQRDALAFRTGSPSGTNWCLPAPGSGIANESNG